ncbi:hypothetical protein [Halomonas huangheensis]|uniref:Uncharacterized protein n=1 Tax=Halomonas huangheensis TaxID=1178482 RepID=W1N6M3_9GAMM|nr:hypothetical protein [Halomonas huangheensis]ALM54249.1 hypothetical protein AR456_19735 [Halomonas huangheensis]ERL50796.1 hypothetical protein BJB45_19565 [Halomonas huangheensis]
MHFNSLILRLIFSLLVMLAVTGCAHDFVTGSEGDLPQRVAVAAALDEQPLTECGSYFRSFEPGSGDLLLAQGCCRVCRTGKACGNSCINRSYTCHKGPGCACNG